MVHVVNLGMLSVKNLFKEYFSNPNMEAYRELTLEHMRGLWNAWRSTLNTQFVKPCKTKFEVLKNVPQGIDAKDWEWLVTNKFFTDEFQKNSERNSKNRGFGFMPHRSGSRPHRQIIYEMGGKDNNPPDIAQIFMNTRQKNGKFVEEEQDKYDELFKTIQENPSLSHIEVVEKCFGPQRHSNVIGFGGGMKRKHFNDSKTAYVKDLEGKLHEKEEENNALKKCMDAFESRLIQIATFEDMLTQIENDKEATHFSPPFLANN